MLCDYLKSLVFFLSIRVFLLFCDPRSYRDGATVRPLYVAIYDCEMTEWFMMDFEFERLLEFITLNITTTVSRVSIPKSNENKIADILSIHVN